MVNHLYSMGIMTIIAVAYIMLASLSTDSPSKVRDTVNVIFWIVVILKFIDINVMILFHRDAIPEIELTKSFYMLVLIQPVSLFGLASWVYRLKTFEVKKFSGMMLMQIILVIQICIMFQVVGS